MRPATLLHGQGRMVIRLAVMALALPPMLAAVDDLRTVPPECVSLAKQVGLPKKLNERQFELAMALLHRAHPSVPVKRCRRAIKRLHG